MEVKSDYVDEEMNDEIDSVRCLLDRLKQEKERELKQTGSSSVEEIGIITDSKQDDVINELQKSQTSLVMNLKPVMKPKEPASKVHQGDETTQNETGDNCKKRKQNSFLVEVQERAEVISKSARKGPETVVSSIAQNTEDDPDAVEFLKAIRAVSSASSDVQIITEEIETRAQRRKSASEVDLSVVVSNSSQLNLEPQKSKISVGRSGSLKARRKPSIAMRRRSLKLSFTDDFDDPISEGDELMDEGESGVNSSGGSFIIKDPPRLGASDEVRPRTRPKAKMKSQTVAGISLPGLAEVLNKRRIDMDDVVIGRPIHAIASESQRPQASAAEIVRAAAEGKKNQAAKEERAEKEPDKPAWLVEAEARRKLHEQRRHNKAKQHDEREQDQEKPLSDVILRPVAPRSEPEVGNSGMNGVVLRSLAPRSEPEVEKSDNSEGIRLHSVMLRPVRKPEPEPTKSEDDDVSRMALNIRLRPVSKAEPVVTQSDKENDSDNIIPRNVVLRPVSKPEPVVNKDKTDELQGMFQSVRLKPIVYPGMQPKVADLEKISSDVTASYSAKVRSSGSSATETEERPRRLRASSDVTSSDVSFDKRVTQSLSHTGTSSRIYENSETASGVTGTTENSSEYHIVHSVRPIPSEKPTVAQGEPMVPEDSPLHTSPLKGSGSRVMEKPTITQSEPKVPEDSPLHTSPLKGSGSRVMEESTITQSEAKVPEDSPLHTSPLKGSGSRVMEKPTKAQSEPKVPEDSPSHTFPLNDSGSRVMKKPTKAQSKPKVPEDSPSHTFPLNGSGSRVMVSSNYVSAPYKMAPKTKPKLSGRSKTVTVTASEVPEPSSARRKSVEVLHAKVEWRGTSSTSVPGHAVSRVAKPHGDLKGSVPRDRSDPFVTSFRPTYSGDVLPQWKIDLMKKKRAVKALPDRPQPIQTSNAVVVPQWRKELAEKRKQRVEVNSVQTNNKENERRTSPEIPLWKKELAERRKRRENSPRRIQPERIDRSPEIPEWKKKLANTRRAQPMVIPRGPTEDPVDQVPSFMREFEKKKRAFPRGGNKASYV